MQMHRMAMKKALYALKEYIQFYSQGDCNMDDGVNSFSLVCNKTM